MILQRRNYLCQCTISLVFNKASKWNSERTLRFLLEEGKQLLVELIEYLKVAFETLMVVIRVDQPFTALRTHYSSSFTHDFNLKNVPIDTRIFFRTVTVYILGNQFSSLSTGLPNKLSKLQLSTNSLLDVCRAIELSYFPEVIIAFHLMRIYLHLRNVGDSVSEEVESISLVGERV